MSSLISDELLRSLMAVGQVDVLVGLPTLNHAGSAGAVVQAAHDAFHGALARERTLLMNVDGGSTDGTPDVVREASAVAARHVLRLAEPAHAAPDQHARIMASRASARRCARCSPRPSCSTPAWC